MNVELGLDKCEAFIVWLAVIALVMGWREQCWQIFVTEFRAL